MSSSKTGRDTPNLHDRNRERISIRSLTQQSLNTPSTVSSGLSPTPSASTKFHQLSNRSASGNRRYHVTVIQQPRIGAAHGPHYLSRVPLAPALIIRLDVLDNNERHLPIDSEIPFFVSTIQLLNEQSLPIRDPPDDPSNAAAQPSAQRLLYGSLVSSPYSLVDLSGQRGVFFMFPDVSVRVEGKYRLGVSLTRLRDHEMTLISSGSVSPLAQVYTDVFPVVGQHEYTAPPSTQLSLHFQQQGAPKT